MEMKSRRMLTLRLSLLLFFLFGTLCVDGLDFLLHQLQFVFQFLNFSLDVVDEAAPLLV